MHLRNSPLCQTVHRVPQDPGSKVAKVCNKEEPLPAYTTPFLILKRSIQRGLLTYFGAVDLPGHVHIGRDRSGRVPKGL